MKETKVANRYAKSLITKAGSEDELDRLAKDMRTIIELVEQYRELRSMLKSPVIRKEKKISVLEQILAEKVGPEAIDMVKMICRKGRENFLRSIAKAYIDQYKVKKNILTAEVTSSFELSNELRQLVLETVRKEEEQEVDLIEKVDPDIIGGIILKVGDQQYDGSVLKQFRGLRAQFT